MAQLNSSNVVNGNIVESNDILQLYDAFTAGGGTTGVYNVSISGSLTGSATSASYALTASYASNVPVTASYALTASYVLSSSYAISSSRAVSSSYALTSSYSSYSLLSATTQQIYTTQVMPSGSNPQERTLKVAAGSITMTGSLATTVASDELKAKTLGTDLFVNATVFGNAGPIVSLRAYNSSTGQLQFNTTSGSGTEFVMWTAMYVPA